MKNMIDTCAMAIAKAVNHFLDNSEKENIVFSCSSDVLDAVKKEIGPCNLIVFSCIE